MNIGLRSLASAAQSYFSTSWAIVLIALLQFVLHLWVAAHDNFFRDELYYIAASRHLDFGFVDYPPLVAVAAGLARLLFGDSLVALRLFPAIAGVIIVLLTADHGLSLNDHWQWRHGPFLFDQVLNIRLVPFELLTERLGAEKKRLPSFFSPAGRTSMPGQSRV